MDTIPQLNAALFDRYDVEREIGAGGMATVYLARDKRHDRHVALKLLRPELGAMLGVERFLAEIRVTAGLQHPNILPLFDSGDADGRLFYVMPYVEGESLRARLTREKQLSIDEALHIAVAAAGALDYAHRRGVIHRDLKPENILMHEGEPLIADFGIALAVSRAGGARITQTGLSLGTPQYMSPEQATGDRTIDARSDIYSLAAVTYEMLAGEPPHSGTTSQAVIAKLLTEEPRPVTALRRTVPVHVDGAIRRALQKLPADRFPTAHDFALGLQGKVPTTFIASDERYGTARQLARARRWLAMASGTAIIAAGAATWAMLDRPQATNRITRLVLNFEPNEYLGEDIGVPFAFSPDGNSIAYIGERGPTRRLYVRRLDELKARELPGTDAAWGPTFSPDGRWIAFTADNAVKKISVDGGPPIPLAPVSVNEIRGLTWGTTGRLAAGVVTGGLILFSETGGDTSVFVPDSVASGQISARWPVMLPDGDHLVYSSWHGGFHATALWIASLRDRKSRPLHVVGAMALGVVGEDLIYVTQNGALMRVSLDLDELETASAPVALSEQVAVDPAAGWARAALAGDGSIVYQPRFSGLELTLADIRTGQTRPLLKERQAYSFPRFSPDGSRIALGITQLNGTTDVWTFDRNLGALQRFSEGEGTFDRPEWTPDARRILFRSGGLQPGIGIDWRVSDRSAPAAPLQRPTSVTRQVVEGVISPDGKWLMVRLFGKSMDVFYRSVTGDTTLRPFLVSPHYETGPRFSPDGKWVAYGSNESSVQQVYVTPFPGPGPRYQISLERAESPVWSPDGSTLYYRQAAQIIAAPLTFTPTFSVGERKVVLNGSYAFNYVHANYDVSPDGKYLLVLRREADAQVIVVRNWGASLSMRPVAAP